MKGIFSEGQLDESELTFKDLHKLSESFARILTGLFHQRIAYPDLNKDKKNGQRQTRTGQKCRPSLKKKRNSAPT